MGIVPKLAWPLVVASVLAAVPISAVAQSSCGGLLQPACPPPPPAPPPPPPPPAPQAVTVTLTPATATREAYRFKSVTYKGRVSPMPGDGTRRLRMQLVFRAPDYRDRQLRGEDFVTEADGSFRVKLRAPAVNAGIRAVVGPGQDVAGESPERPLSITENRTLQLRALSRGRALFTYRSVADRRIELPNVRTIRMRKGKARRAYLYVASRGARYAYRVVGARMGGLGCVDSRCARRATARFKVTRRVQRATDIFACARASAFRGIGDGTIFKPCGSRRIRIR